MKVKRIFFILFIILLVSLIIYSSVNLLKQKQIQKSIDSINNNPIIYYEESGNAITKLQEEYNNKDIKGILKVANTNIVLVQGIDNSYYLNHLIDKKINKTGSVFIDYRTNIDTSRQVNIYGHSSDYYNVSFNILKKYLNKKFYLDNKYIYIDTIDKSYKYEIFSVKVTSDEDHLKVIFNNLDEFNNHLIKLKNNSLYDTGVSVNENDKLLVLQTCINNNPLGKLLIINLRKVG